MASWFLQVLRRAHARCALHTDEGRDFERSVLSNGRSSERSVRTKCSPPQIDGVGQPLEIDGVGGGNPLSSKVAMVDRSAMTGVDVDYLFAQVDVLNPLVDTAPNC